MAKICVLRLGHRRNRDQRVTTHVFLAARALGASEGVLCGDEDGPLISGIRKVCEFWGGDFEIRFEQNWKRFVGQRKESGWKIAHLTMYGEDYEEGARKLVGKDIVVVIGAGKVPHAAYEIADANLAVLNQPHSEISALALFLDRLGVKGSGATGGGKMRILPNKCGKTVVRV